MKARLHPAVAVVTWLALALLYAPMLAVMVFSVNNTKTGFVWRGFTTRWYTQLVSGPEMLQGAENVVLSAALNTLILAVASTLVSTVLGTMLAIGMARTPWPRWFRRYLDFSVFLPVVTPDIVFGAAAVVVFGLLRASCGLFDRWFAPGLVPMIIAHVTFQISFVALVVGSRLRSIPPSLQEAARDLYAGSLGVLLRVLLPLLGPGIVAGAMLAFTLSLDDFVISFFTAGPESTTLPILIYGQVRRGVSPEIHALSTIIFLTTFVLVVAMERFTRHRKDDSHEKEKLA